MAGINKVILVGNLGADPEIRTLENGVKVARINVATTEVYRDRNGERREITEWHQVTLWRGLAEVTERYLAKGRQVYIEGKLKTRKWVGEDGRDRYTTEVIADVMQMLGRAPGSQDGSYTRSDGEKSEPTESAERKNQEGDREHASVPENAKQAPDPREQDDDLPF